MSPCRRYLIRAASLAALLASLLSLALQAACDSCRSQAASEVVVYTSVDQVFSDPVLRAFERESGIAVRAVFDTEETKSTGVLNRLIAESKAPQADVFWSGDPVRPFLLIKRELVEPYQATNAAAIPATFRASDGTWTGSAARVRVLLVNTNLVAADSGPTSIRDLTDPRWKGRVTIANPLFGTTTMHVAAWFSVWGDERGKDFMNQLRANEVRVASSNGEVKRLVAAGEVAFGLTDTDDANEALEAGAPVRVVYPDAGGDGTLVMPTTAVIIKNGPNPRAARRLVEFLLSAGSERMMAENAAHMPLRSDVSPPANGRRVRDIRAMEVDYQRVGDEMERIQPWLREWVGL